MALPDPIQKREGMGAIVAQLQIDEKGKLDLQVNGLDVKQLLKILDSLKWDILFDLMQKKIQVVDPVAAAQMLAGGAPLGKG